MTRKEDPTQKEYPHGRGYGHDYMRGGEVFGGYGYEAREEYQAPRGSLETPAINTDATEDTDNRGLVS